MYIPKKFSEPNQEVLHAFMEEYRFAALVTSNNGQLCATHVPFSLDRSRGEHGTLVAHMARANQQWRDIKTAQEALVIFQGPHAYITPSWYEPVSTNVPTWNMTVVHAYGIPRLIENHDELYAMLTRLVNENERGFESPWTIQNSEAYVHRAIEAIVGIEVALTRLEGKFKLSQNRSETDQQHVMDALAQSQNELDRQVGQWMDRRR